MKKILSVALGAVLALSILFGASYADAASRVSGYTRSNGTYVAPYYRSTANYTVRDNYSTKGNYNPYTGKAGTRVYSSYRY
jgi:hypothetical protein